jgi:hypothetical protein
VCVEASTVLRAVAEDFFFNCRCLNKGRDFRVLSVSCLYSEDQWFVQFCGVRSWFLRLAKVQEASLRKLPLLEAVIKQRLLGIEGLVYVL